MTSVVLNASCEVLSWAGTATASTAPAIATTWRGMRTSGRTASPRDRPHVSQGGIRPERGTAHPLVAAPLQEERAEHDGEHGDVDGGRARRVAEKDLAKDTEPDCRGDRHPKLVHACDDGGGDGHE